MPTTPPPPVTDATSLAVSILDGLLVLVAVCLLAYLLLRYGLGRLSRRGAGGSVIRVVARADLDPRRSLLAVRVGRRAFLIGSSEQGLSRLAELDAAELPEVGDPSPSAFARLLKRETRDGGGGIDDAGAAGDGGGDRAG